MDMAFRAIAGARCFGLTAWDSTRFSPRSGVSATNWARNTGPRHRSSFRSSRRERNSPTYRAKRARPDVRSTTPITVHEADHNPRSRSASTKLRFALFHEGTYALLQVIRSRAICHPNTLVRELFRDGIAQGPIHQPLGLRDGDRRCNREALEDLFRLRVQLRVRDHPVHQTDPQRLLGIEAVAEKRELFGNLDAHSPRQVIRRRRVGRESQPNVRQEEFRAVGRDREVGTGHEGERRAGAEPAHAAYHRFGHALENHPQRCRVQRALFEIRAELLDGLVDHLHEALDVAAGHEVFTRARNREAPHIRIIFDAATESEHFLYHGSGHGVASVRPVDHHAGDALLYTADQFLAHRSFSEWVVLLVIRSAIVAPPRINCTTAFTSSPNSAFGTPKTAASNTFGCVVSTFSASCG